MKHRYLLWQDKLLLLALLSTFYAYSSYIRVAIRALVEGPAFRWAYFAGVTPNGSVAVVSGQGIYGSFDYVLTAAFAVTFLLWCGLRRPDAHFRAGLLGWTSLGAAAALWLTLGTTDRLASGKETLGLADLPHFWVEVLPVLLAWSLALLLVLRGRQPSDSRPRPAWSPANRAFALAALACMGLAGLLLNLGPQHGSADFGGIGLLYASLCLAWLAASPWKAPAGRAAADPAVPTGEAGEALNH
jgi:hypothetical protein